MGALWAAHSKGWAAIAGSKASPVTPKAAIILAIKSHIKSNHVRMLLGNARGCSTAINGHSMKSVIKLLFNPSGICY